MANTTNLNLVPLDGSNTLKNFPTPYNENLNKIDAFAGKITAFTDEYTVSAGYFAVSNAKIKTNSIVVGTIHRSDNVWVGYQIFPRIISDGSMYVYIRDSSGNNYPANNSKIVCHFIVFTP